VVGEESGGEPFVSFRQNQKSVTAVVRVADIEEASVAVEIARTSVHMRFSALADADGAGGAEACKGVSKRRVNYAHTLHLSADVDPMQSRYDVSSSNLVLVLRKAEDTRWPTFTGAPRDAASADGASGCGANTAAAYDAAQEATGSAAAAAAAAAEVAAAGASAARAEDSDAADGKQEQKKGVRFGGEVGPTGGGGGGGGEGASGAGEGAGCVCCAAAGEAGPGLAGGREAETTASKEASKEASKAEARRVVGANGEVFESGDSFAGSKVSLSPRTTPSLSLSLLVRLLLRWLQGLSLSSYHYMHVSYPVYTFAGAKVCACRVCACRVCPQAPCYYASVLDTSIRVLIILCISVLFSAVYIGLVLGR
jgi:hypothetical protein